MKFRAELRNIRAFSKLVAALNSLDKIVWMRLNDDMVRFIVLPDRGVQVWSDFLFDDYILQSLNAGNTIDIELTLASLQRALRSALNSSDATIRLAKRDGMPVLAMTIHTMSAGSGNSNSHGRRGGFYGRESTLGDTSTTASQNNNNNSMSEAEAAMLELPAHREREKTVIQNIPVRLLNMDAVEGGSLLEPTVPEADVHIVLPPLLQLKAVSDRFTKLAAGTANPKLELSANMYGMLRLRLVTDALSVETVWRDLENPPMVEEALPVPLAEHPSTRFREAGPDRFATVRVDGRDWSRVLSVGRMEGSRVIACFVDGQGPLTLHVYVAQPDEPDDAEESSVITYYVSSYSS